jgi:hypothetical protein
MDDKAASGRFKTPILPRLSRFLVHHSCPGALGLWSTNETCLDHVGHQTGSLSGHCAQPGPDFSLIVVHPLAPSPKENETGAFTLDGLSRSPTHKPHARKGPNGHHPLHPCTFPISSVQLLPRARNQDRFGPHSSTSADASSKQWDRITPANLGLPPRYSDACKQRMDLPSIFHPDLGPGSSSLPLRHRIRQVLHSLLFRRGRPFWAGQRSWPRP